MAFQFSYGPAPGAEKPRTSLLAGWSAYDDLKKPFYSGVPGTYNDGTSELHDDTVAERNVVQAAEGIAVVATPDQLRTSVREPAPEPAVLGGLALVAAEQ